MVFVSSFKVIFFIVRCIIFDELFYVTQCKERKKKKCMQILTNKTIQIYRNYKKHDISCFSFNEIPRGEFHKISEKLKHYDSEDLNILHYNCIRPFDTYKLYSSRVETLYQAGLLLVGGR